MTSGWMTIMGWTETCQLLIESVAQGRSENHGPVWGQCMIRCWIWACPYISCLSQASLSHSLSATSPGPLLTAQTLPSQLLLLLSRSCTVFFLVTVTNHVCFVQRSAWALLSLNGLLCDFPGHVSAGLALILVGSACMVCRAHRWAAGSQVCQGCQPSGQSCCRCWSRVGSGSLYFRIETIEMREAHMLCLSPVLSPSASEWQVAWKERFLFSAFLVFS